MDDGGASAGDDDGEYVRVDTVTYPGGGGSALQGRTSCDQDHGGWNNALKCDGMDDTLLAVAFVNLSELPQGEERPCGQREVLGRQAGRGGLTRSGNHGVRP